MDFESLQKSRQGKIITNRKTLSAEIKRSISMLIFTLLLIIILLSIVYLLNTNTSAQKGYIFTQNQVKKQELLIENHDLINKIIQVMTYKNIQESPLLQKMIKPENPVYIKPN